MRDHLATLLDDFRRFPGDIAVVRYHGNRRRVSTYGDIAQLAGRFAAFLADNKIGPGDRVMIWGENSAQWISAFYGCMLRGVLSVPLDAYGSPDFAARVAQDVRPNLIVGDALLLSKLPADLYSKAALLRFEDWDNTLPARQAGPVESLGHQTPLQILFTSGTTGEPKGVVLTHGNVLASVGPIERGAQGYLKYERLIHPLRIMHTLPLSHVFGQTMGLWIPPVFRAQVHFETRLVAPQLVETIHRERISVLAAVPRVFGLLKTYFELQYPNLAEEMAAAQKTRAGTLAWKRWWKFRAVHRALGLKFWSLICGGGALPPELERFWNTLGFVLVQGYGMTETTALITLNHPFHVAKGTIGKPLPGREVKLGPDGEVLVRGPMISSATWTGGEMQTRQSEWLATGDLAETAPTGELRFVGRKSEVIVTANGVNIHPEDLEAILEEQPGVAACAVVPLQTAIGIEPCAVLAMRGAVEVAPKAVEQANSRLADFQQIRRWVIWPEPDLPRTTTGKVRRKALTDWLLQTQSPTGKRSEPSRASTVSSDWLLSLIHSITGELPEEVNDHLRINEDLHLDGLAKVQLAAAIEQRLGMPPESGMLEDAQTLGDIRQLLRGSPIESVERRVPPSKAVAITDNVDGGLPFVSPQSNERAKEELPPSPSLIESTAKTPDRRYVYPHWPWLAFVRWARVSFVEIVMRPLVWLLANPRVVAPASLDSFLASGEPLLIVANHVTAYDGPLVQYALPGKIRRRVAAAMSGEMIDDFRHWRNPERGPRYQKFFLLGPAFYYLLTALFNVFPLPRLRDFQKSFAHAGDALDHGYNVLVFPEGSRSPSGGLANFRPGIGILTRQSGTAVLPVAIRGLGDLKTGARSWFRSGTIEVRVGEPVRFSPETGEAEITARLHSAVNTLLNGMD